MATTSFYTREELESLGFKSLGKDVLVSRNARFYGIDNISIGDNVRIDDFCILSGKITLGSHIHVSSYVALYGAMGITFEDYTGVSSRTTIYSAMDDFSGDYLVGAIHDDVYTNVSGGEVIVRKYAHIGAHCLLFPNLEIGEGTVVGAFSMVRKTLPPWGIYAGIPVRKLKERNNGMCKLAQVNDGKYDR